MTDKYGAYAPLVDAPARHAVAITPADGSALDTVPKAIYVGVTGDITMVGVDAASGAAGVLFKNCVAGSIIPFRPREIKATGTTATNIVGLL
jgi:hypothetical protein